MSLSATNTIMYDSIQEIAEKLYPRILESAIQKEARDYLASFRKISLETLEDAYAFYVLSEVYFEDLLEDEFEREYIGLRTRNDNIFRERFIFPIRGINNSLLGWSGYDAESTTKYLFARAGIGGKDRIFYNYNNIEACFKEDSVIVVEGLFHSLRLNELGVLNNLCLLGKRMTSYHIRVLNRFDLKILIPDNDEAGRKAEKNWKRDLTGKLAIIKLRDETDPESGKPLTDIDDKLKIDKGRYADFVKLYNRIKKDADDITFNIETYSF